ncbi:WD40 repeat domain-containing protein [Chloropicon primus]|uniref:WD40 repeat domain-containing protein n=2 Tax=Chloropicon primus TaxID=1764295 RepID=A0A5B8MYC2_9CHLO|nr:WD40 repeat domain-containing protein [Chloropicon primus]UPR03738.1 WD40 repeat domain-containing protein [Chloropicon primus]|eukprot:QDZ24530.1 WD40 repeat domain-containing protein [Chloropicon primus]
MLALHRSRCVDWRPKPIVAFAATAGTVGGKALEKEGSKGVSGGEVGTSEGDATAGGDLSLLAVARGSGRIEVWKKMPRSGKGSPGGLSEKNAWQKIKDVPGLRSVVCKCLTWVRGEGKTLRLIGGTLEGNLVEIDLSEKKPRKLTVDAPGCGIWSIDSADYEEGSEVLGCTSLIACACDDGALRVFGTKVGESDFKLVQTYPKADCRLLSLAMHKGRYVVVGGSDGYLSYWDLEQQKELFSINGKFQRNLDVSIWSVAVLDNGDIVSGDSAGSVRIWDGKFGSMLKNFALHKRDVLCVVSCKDKIFSSGVDGQINLLTNEQKGGGVQQWGFKGKKRPHSHDVMALAMSSGTLFSGGNDTRLMSYDAQSFLERHPVNVQAYGEVPHIQLASKKGSLSYMLCQQLDAVELWEIHTVDQDSSAKAKLVKGKEGQPLETKTCPKLLAVLSSGSNIFSSSMSPDGRLVAYSNMTSLHLYSVFDQHGKLAVQKIKSVPIQLQNIQFTPNNKCVVGTNLKNEVCVYESDDLKELHVFEQAPASAHHFPAQTDELLSVSPNSEFVAVTSKRRVVLVFNLLKSSLQGVIKLDHSASSLCFETDTSLLLIGTVEQQVMFYDASSCTLCDQYVAHGQQVARRLKFISGSIKNMSCLKGEGDKFVLLNTVRGLCFVNFGKPTKELKGKGSSQHPKKRSRVGYGLQLAAQEGQNPRILPLEDPCLFATFLGERSALIVECPWLKALRDIPKPLHRKIYGMA